MHLRPKVPPQFYPRRSRVPMSFLCELTPTSVSTPSPRLLLVFLRPGSLTPRILSPMYFVGW